MLTEQWSKWIPAPGLEGPYTLEKISGNLWALEVELIGPSPQSRVQIFFEFTLIAYQATALSWRKKTLQIIREQIKKEDGNETFFKVNNSQYAQWLSKQSCEIRMPEEFTHYVLITSDLMLDIAGWGVSENPKISVAAF